MTPEVGWLLLGRRGVLRKISSPVISSIVFDGRSEQTSTPVRYELLRSSGAIGLALRNLGAAMILYQPVGTAGTDG